MRQSECSIATGIGEYYLKHLERFASLPGQIWPEDIGVVLLQTSNRKSLQKRKRETTSRNCVKTEPTNVDRMKTDRGISTDSSIDKQSRLPLCRLADVPRQCLQDCSAIVNPI